MKKKIRKRLGQVIVIGMIFLLILFYCLQIKMVHTEIEQSSEVLFGQINRILYENTLEMKEVKKSFREQCLVKARAAAYMIQNHPASDENDQKEMKKIAKLLEIDELHLFNKKGEIYAGSEPKYFGYNFNSGKQMQFFLPMMKDKSLSLCQPITPNTAEGKLMQYAAVWREDGKGIIQIGMEPVRILELMEKNELSYIFSMLTKNDGADLYAADPDTFEILGSTNEKSVGKSLIEYGFNQKSIIKNKGFYTTLNGQKAYCIFTDLNNILVGRVYDTDTLNDRINANVFLLVLSLAVICFVMIWSISRYLDKYIIRGIVNINEKLQHIARGKMDETVNVRTTPEFEELSGHINQMVRSLLDMKDKFSSVLNIIQVPIGIYEYSHGMERVEITKKVAEILELSETEEMQLTTNVMSFQEKINEIKKHPVQGETDVFQLSGNKDRFIKIESYINEDGFFGILMDVTADIMEKKRIEQERDEDSLTGLYGRRAFYAQVENLFHQASELRNAAVIMIDTDNLKKINDTFGHKVGDYYLQGMAEVLRKCTAPKKIAAHLSGDEFALLIYGCSSRAEVESYIKQIERYQQGFDVEFSQDLQLSVKFSIGSAFYPEDGQDYHSLLNLADKRMYREKYQKKQNI